MTVADQITRFLFNLRFPLELSNGVQVLDVHKDTSVQKACISFYEKFYGDQRNRYMLIGINPGRFGGGVTGIPFTDPVRLEKDCGIPNQWPKKQELSSVFMYEMMQAYGGVKAFYDDIYITAISPLGFVKDGKNLNYYDDKYLKEAIKPFVVQCLEAQLAFGLRREACFVIGEGENLKYFTALNNEYQWFQTVEAVAHPRFIMQYKLKFKQDYIDKYLATFRKYTGV
ncbi:MAG: hypothetical protein K0Q66_38 [Chitinophagaceae bacterium]|jgi:hypothetical protein|nr:hypothetical protein [Chitinophagaceae bacterium]